MVDFNKKFGKGKNRIIPLNPAWIEHLKTDIKKAIKLGVAWHASGLIYQVNKERNNAELVAAIPSKVNSKFRKIAEEIFHSLNVTTTMAPDAIKSTAEEFADWCMPRENRSEEECETFRRIKELYKK